MLILAISDSSSRISVSLNKLQTCFKEVHFPAYTASLIYLLPLISFLEHVPDTESTVDLRLFVVQ